MNGVSFVIPFLNDSQDRFKNLSLILKFLSCKIKSMFPFEIIIVNMKTKYTLEFDKTDLLKNCSGVECVFHEIFDAEVKEITKSKLVNIGIRISKYDIICIHDTDCLVKPDNYLQSFEICTNIEDMVYPFDGTTFNVEREYYELLKYKLDISVIPSDSLMLAHKKNDFNAGGIFFIHKNILKDIGYMNQEYIGWG